MVATAPICKRETNRGGATHKLTAQTMDLRPTQQRQQEGGDHSSSIDEEALPLLSKSSDRLSPQNKMYGSGKDYEDDDSETVELGVALIHINTLPSVIYFRNQAIKNILLLIMLCTGLETGRKSMISC